ncbi:MAG: hypothetical protein E5Y32_21170 [Mesorhizobium sp.]|nr:MAG: hypothetical protein E5Y32_21170 [Mesorhizobium sp.]
MSNVRKFPVSTSTRIINRRGKMALSCIVSDRWLRFGKPHEHAMNVGTPISLDVMRDFSGPDEKTRKLCSLIVTVEDLRKLLAEIDKR